MVMVDHQIRDAVTRGELGIENFDPGLVQPASYDLRVGPLVYSATSPNPDQPVDLSRNGGAFRLPPYASALFMTYESLRMPITVAGRFGLTSSFARKGLLASTGPQVDPGFHGKLFVSLMNLTPVSHVIKYKETFLSIVFEHLEAQPERAYDGPYQDRYEITAEILEDLVRLEGVNLSQMQREFTELSRHLREWTQLAQRFEEFLQSMERHTTAIERLVGALATRHAEEGADEARHVSLEEAVQEVLQLFREKRRLFYSDIAEALRLDLATVIEACEELQRRGLIEGDHR